MLEFLLHLLCLLYIDLKSSMLTYILDSGSGMTCEPHRKWLLRQSVTLLVVSALLDETPAPSSLAEGAPSAAESAIESPCLVGKKLAG